MFIKETETKLATLTQNYLHSSFNKYRKATKLTKVGFSLASIIILSSVGFYFFNSQTEGANFTWLQTDWSGGESTDTANHADNQTSWTKYFSKDSNINTTSGELKLSSISGSISETSDEDFNAGTHNNTYASGGSIRVLKPDGATCSTGTECSCGSCISNVCSTFSCSTSTVKDADNNTYNTVQIGTQCWMKENMRVGTMLASGSTLPSNNSLIEKWCYNNTASNCTTYGGFYTWAEANQLATTCNSTSCTSPANNQGICPTGFHIPTDNEYKTLEMYLGMTQAQADATSWRGTDQGSQLSSYTSGGTNSSGFTALLAGYRRTVGSFYNQDAQARLWSASEGSATGGWLRGLGSGVATVYRHYDIKEYGFSVRCLKDVPLCSASTACGASCTASDGMVYGTVLADDGRCWLDRNLGATRVATSYNDSNAYGWYYQWGRGADGHQIPTSDTTAILSSSDTPGNSNFIYGMGSPYDWRSPQNNNLWQGISGTNNPCPTGFRLPTSSEWSVLVSAANITNYATAYSSSLKLTLAGHRYYSNASLTTQGSFGFYWASDVSGTQVSDLSLNSSGVNPVDTHIRGNGFSVRCVKE